jgi:hypothetical protein
VENTNTSLHSLSMYRTTLMPIWVANFVALCNGWLWSNKNQSNAAAEWSKVLTRIRKVPTSILGPEASWGW